MSLQTLITTCTIPYISTFTYIRTTLRYLQHGDLKILLHVHATRVLEICLYRYATQRHVSEIKRDNVIKIPLYGHLPILYYIF